MEGEGCYCIPDGIQLSSFPSECSGSQESAATGGTSPANKVSKAEEKKRIEKLEKEIEATLKCIFQLGNTYLVFQGVIFTTIFSSPSPVKCQYRWLPISLSSIAGLLNLAILTNLILKHDQLMYERDLDLAGVGSRPVPSYLEEKRQNAAIDIRDLFGYVCSVSRPSTIWFLEDSLLPKWLFSELQRQELLRAVQ